MSHAPSSMGGGGGAVELQMMESGKEISRPPSPPSADVASASDSPKSPWQLYNALKSKFQQYSSSTKERDVANILGKIRKLGQDLGNETKYEILEGRYTLRYNKPNTLRKRHKKDVVSLREEDDEDVEHQNGAGGVDEGSLGLIEVEQDDRFNVYMMVAKQPGGDEKKRLNLLRIVGCYCLCECKKDFPCGFNPKKAAVDVEEQKNCPNKYFRESDDYFLNDYNRSEGYSALSLIVAKDDVECLNYLVEYCGASLLPSFTTSKITKKFDKAFQNKYEISLVDFKGEENRENEGKASLIYSLDDIRTFKRGLNESVLHVACRLGRLEAAKAICKLAEEHCKIECSFMANIKNDRVPKIGFLKEAEKKVPRHLKWLLAEPFQDEQPPFWCKSLPDLTGTKFLVPRLRNSRKDNSFVPERPGGDSLITDEDVENHPKGGKEYGASKYMSSKEDVARGLTYFVRDASGATCLSSICRMHSGGQINFTQLVPVVEWLLDQGIPQDGGFHKKTQSASVVEDGTSNLMLLLEALASKVGMRFYQQSILPAGKKIFDILVKALGSEVHYVNEYTNETALYRSVRIPGKAGKDIREALLTKGAEKTIALAVLDLSCYQEDGSSEETADLITEIQDFIAEVEKNLASHPLDSTKSSRSINGVDTIKPTLPTYAQNAAQLLKDLRISKEGRDRDMRKTNAFLTLTRRTIEGLIKSEGKKAQKLAKLLENAAKFGFERTPLEHAVENNADAVTELMEALSSLKFENSEKRGVKKMVCQAFRRAIVKPNYELMAKLFNEAPQILEKIGVPKEATWRDLTDVFKEEFKAQERFEWDKTQGQINYRKAKPAWTYYSALKTKGIVDIMFSNASLFQDFICQNVGKNEYYFDIFLAVMKKHDRLELYNKTLPTVFKALSETTHHELVLYWLMQIARQLKKASKEHLLQRGDFEKKVEEVEVMIKDLFNSESMSNMDALLSVLCRESSVLQHRYNSEVVNMAQAFYGGPLKLALEEDLSIFGISQISTFVDRCFYKDLRATSYPDSLKYNSKYFLSRYNASHCFLMEGFGKLLFLAVVSVEAVNYEYPTSESPYHQYSGLQLFIILMLIASVLYEIGDVLGDTMMISDNQRSVTRVAKRYLDTWNFLDCLSLGCVLIWVILHSYPEQRDVALGFLSVSAIFFSLSMLAYLSIVEAIGKIVLILFSMVKDLIAFLVIFLACIYGFGVTMRALFQHLYPYVTNGMAVKTLLDSVVGLHDVSIFDGSYYAAFGVTLEYVFILMTTIVLINLLIAKMNNTFSQGSAKADCSWGKYKAEITRKHLAIAEKSPLCVLPAPFNLLVLPIYPLHWAWLSLQRDKMRTTKSEDRFENYPPNLEEILEDLVELDKEKYFICHQCDCEKRNEPKSYLAGLIYKKYPEANIYKKENRKPGENYVVSNVINMCAQNNPKKGTDFDNDSSPLAIKEKESKLNRERYFKLCLEALPVDAGNKLPLRAFAFPENIGCSNAGGDWPTYREMLIDFAKRNPDFQVKIVKKPTLPYNFAEIEGNLLSQNHHKEFYRCQIKESEELSETAKSSGAAGSAEAANQPRFKVNGHTMYMLIPKNSNTSAREQAFEACLKEIAENQEIRSSRRGLAFPKYIGCSENDGGHWPFYRDMIIRFAEEDLYVKDSLPLNIQIIDEIGEEKIEEGGKVASWAGIFADGFLFTVCLFVSSFLSAVERNFRSLTSIWYGISQEERRRSKSDSLWARLRDIIEAVNRSSNSETKILLKAHGLLAKFLFARFVGTSDKSPFKMPPLFSVVWLLLPFYYVSLLFLLFICFCSLLFWDWPSILHKIFGELAHVEPRRVVCPMHGHEMRTLESCHTHTLARAREGYDKGHCGGNGVKGVKGCDYEAKYVCLACKFFLCESCHKHAHDSIHQTNYKAPYLEEHKNDSECMVLYWPRTTKQFEYRQAKNMRYEKHVCIKALALSCRDNSLSNTKDAFLRFIIDPWWTCTQAGLSTGELNLSFKNQEQLFLPFNPWGQDLKFIAATIRVEVVDPKFKKRPWDEPKEFVIADGQIDLAELCELSKELKTGEVPLEDHFKIDIVPRIGEATQESGASNDVGVSELCFRLFIAKGETPKDIPSLIKQGYEDANAVRAAANVVLAQTLKNNSAKKYPSRTWLAVANRVSSAIALQPNEFYTPLDFERIFNLRGEEESATKVPAVGSSKDEETLKAADAEAASDFMDLNETVLIYFNKPIKNVVSKGDALEMSKNTGLHKLFEGDDTLVLPSIDKVHQFLRDEPTCAQKLGGKDDSKFPLLPLHFAARARGDENSSREVNLELKYNIITSLLDAFPDARNYSLPCAKSALCEDGEKCLPLILAINSGLSDSRIINALWTKEAEAFKGDASVLMLAIRKGVDSESICSILEAFPNAAQISSIDKKQFPLHELLKRPQTYSPSPENTALAALIHACPQALTSENSEGKMPYKQRLAFTVVTKEKKLIELSAVLDFSQPNNYISKDAITKLVEAKDELETLLYQLDFTPFYHSSDDRNAMEKLSFHKKSEEKQGNAEKKNAGVEAKSVDGKEKAEDAVDLVIGCPIIARPTKDDEYQETLCLLETLRVGIPDHKEQLPLHHINIETSSERVETLLKYNEAAVEAEDIDGNLPIHCFLSSIAPKIAFKGDTRDERQSFYADKLRSEFKCELLPPDTGKNSYDCLVRMASEDEDSEEQQAAVLEGEGKVITVQLGDVEQHVLWADLKGNIKALLKQKVEHEDKKKSVKDILSLLLDKNKKSLLHHNKFGDLPLHVALSYGHDTAALKLLASHQEEFDKHRTKLESPDQPEIDLEDSTLKKVKMKNQVTDSTALHIAIEKGASFEVVKKCFEIYPRARVEKNKDNLLPINLLRQEASNKEEKEKIDKIIDLLLLSLPDEHKDKEEQLNSWTPSELARASYALVIELIQRKPELFIGNDKDGKLAEDPKELPIHFAVKNNAALNVIKVLNFDFDPPIHSAVNIAELKSGPMKTRDREGMLPIHYAIISPLVLLEQEKIKEVKFDWKTRREVIDYLFNEESLVEVVGENEVNKFGGYSLLHLCLHEYAPHSQPHSQHKVPPPIFGELLGKIRSFDKLNQILIIQDSQGRTPLHLACEYRAPFEGVIEHLTTYRDACLIQDKEGRYPLTYALEFAAEYETIERLLVDRALLSGNNDPLVAFAANQNKLRVEHHVHHHLLVRSEVVDSSKKWQWSCNGRESRSSTSLLPCKGGFSYGGILSTEEKSFHYFCDKCGFALCENCADYFCVSSEDILALPVLELSSIKHLEKALEAKAYPGELLQSLVLEAWYSVVEDKQAVIGAAGGSGAGSAVGITKPTGKYEPRKRELIERANADFSNPESELAQIARLLKSHSPSEAWKKVFDLKNPNEHSSQSSLLELFNKVQEELDAERTERNVAKEAADGGAGGESGGEPTAAPATLRAVLKLFSKHHAKTSRIFDKIHPEVHLMEEKDTHTSGRFSTKSRKREGSLSASKHGSAKF